MPEYLDYTKREKNKRNKLNMIDKYVIFSITMMIIYTTICLACLWRGLMIDSTLTTCFFGFFGGELVMSCLIKIFKLKEEPKKNNCDDIDPEPIENDEGGVG